MAIAKMRRLRLVGLKSDQNVIMNELVRSGTFEVAPTSVEGAHPTDRSHLDKAVARQAKVSFAIQYLTGCAEEYLARKEEAKKKATTIPEAPVDALPRGGRKIMGYDDFYDVAAKEYELLTVCDALQKSSFTRLENKSLLGKVQAQIRAVLPYVAFPSPFSVLGEGATVSVSLWYAQSAVAKCEFGDLPVYTETYPSERGVLTAVVARKEDKDAVASLMVGAGFGSCPFTDAATAQDMLRGYEAQIREIHEKNTAVLYDALHYYKYLPELKTLYDVIGQDIEKSSAELDFVTTASTFVAEGWLPADCAEEVVAHIGKKTERVITYLSEPEEGDTPPTLVVSKKIFKPYEDVTNMYSVPAYNELDPNPFMAVFFFLFFGIMIGDAGYGLILSLGGLILLKCMKFEKGMARMIALMAMGGVSAIAWGILFGGVFAIASVPPLWFSPMEEPLMMLAVSIILGAAQLLAGYALKAAKSFRAGKPLDAVLDSIFIYILFGGIACMALDMLLKPQAPLMEIGLGLLIASLVGILCTAGRHNKGIVSKIMGGFSGLYGLVNLLSDLLSYARIFGLGLASGAIGLAFNTLGELFFGIPFVGYVIGIIILIPLHAFNLGIGVLGAYVHNARLQFLEFYGKFYEGDGRMFSPMGEKTKYVRFH